MPDPSHLLRRAAHARPISRVLAHLVVVAIVAFSTAFGINAARGTDPAPATPQTASAFDLVGTVRGAAGQQEELHSTSYSVAADPLNRQEQIERRAEALNAPPFTYPTPAATPVAPPPATPEPAPSVKAPTVVARTGSAPTAGGALLWPIANGGVISQYYHSGHLALDIAAPYGSTIVASAGGTVIWAGWRNNGGGNVIEIDHGNGMHTVYNHLSAIWVSAGQHVARGVGIGAVGCTGMCTGPHVHFEVIVNGVIVNPLRYL